MMKLNGNFLTPPRELCSRMHGSVLIWILPQMTPPLCVLILSSLFSVQPVLSEPVFSTQPEDGVGVLGAPLVLHCAVYDSRQQGALSVRWERASGEPVGSHQLANGSLFFPQLRERHLGQYVCSAGTGSEHITTIVQVEKAGLGDVFFSPQAQTVREGEGVFLQCVSGESSPPAHITWLKDGTLVTTGRQIQGQYGGGNQKKTSGSLHLYNITLEDEGVYVCVTHNPLLNISRESKPAKLTVLGVPRRLQITQGPDNITVAMGTQAFMRCTVLGFPVPMVHWFKDSCLLTNCSTSFSLQDNGQLLVFRNVSKEDEGSYHCEASNQRETIKSQSAFLLPAVMGWSFVQQPTSLTVQRGEDATMICRPPYSRPAAHVSWFRNNRLLNPRAHFTVMPSGDLYFHSVQESDSGTYFCRASNTHLHRAVTSRRVTLTVLAPPSVKLWPQVVTVPVGAQVVLECQVWGHPTPSISWFKEGHSVRTGGKIAVGVRNATLYILSVRSYDEGTYVCEASNTLGRDRSTATLRVAVSPIIVSTAGQVSGRMGASVVLPCTAVGIPPITYTWTRGRADTRTSISPTEDRHIDDDGDLHISNVQWSDAGEYYCTAENRAGRQQRHTTLTITAEDHPADRGKQTRLILSASTNIDKELPVSGVVQLSGATHHPHVQIQHEDRTTCPASHCNPTTKRPIPFSTPTRGTMFGLKGSPGSQDHHSQHPLNQPTTNPTQPIVTQMQPPMLLPPPYLNFQSADPHIEPPVTSTPFLFSTTEPPITHSQPPWVNNRLLVTSIQYLLSQSQSHLTKMTSGTQFPYRVIEPPKQLLKHDAQVSGVSLPSQIMIPLTQTEMSQLPSKILWTRPSGSPKQAPYSLTHTQDPVTQAELHHSDSVTFSLASQAELQLSQTHPQQPFTQSPFSQSNHEPSPTQHSQTKLQQYQGQFLYQKTSPQPSPTISQISHPQQPFTQSLFPLSRLQPSPTQDHPPSIQPQPSSHQGQPSPTQPQSPSTISPLPQTQNQTQSSPTHHPLDTQPPLPQTQSSPTHHPLDTQPPLPQTESLPPQIQTGNPLKPQPSVSTTHSPDQSSSLSTSDPDVPVTHQVTTSDQVHPNASQQGHPAQSAKSANDTEITEWLKRNTSQSPMTSNDPRVTQQSPSWLPVLEKHDIPIVVGVGVSLAFIFISMAFYSLVQKNEPAPTSRAAQRNLGVPVRNAERRATGRTYENKAFEDDDCVAVIEQSPNTSDTRARPPGPSLVTVQMEPTSEDLQEDTQPTLEDHSVTVETYPEPILDTQIDPSLEEDKGCSLSQPSIQLQCVEDWASSGGDNLGPCQDALPPPSSLPSCSPTPSPPPGHEEGLRSSLTLQTAEPCIAPIHHSLSISHGNPPLLLSHHVSMGLTTVAVDVHFYPAATAPMAVATSTHINSVSNTTSVAPPLFSSPLGSQENDQLAARMHQ